MCDRRRVAGVGHGADLVEPLLVASSDALVLAEVFVPGGDNELFNDPARVGGVLPGPPGAGPGAAPTESGILQGGEQVVVESVSGPVLNGHHDRPAGRVAGCQVWLWPVPGGQEFLRRDRLEPVAQPGDRAEREPRRGCQQC